MAPLWCKHSMIVVSDCGFAGFKHIRHTLGHNTQLLTVKALAIIGVILVYRLRPQQFTIAVIRSKIVQSPLSWGPMTLSCGLFFTPVRPKIGMSATNMLS
jgi:hypothetical protein